MCEFVCCARCVVVRLCAVPNFRHHRQLHRHRHVLRRCRCAPFLTPSCPTSLFFLCVSCPDVAFAPASHLRLFRRISRITSPLHIHPVVNQSITSINHRRLSVALKSVSVNKNTVLLRGGVARYSKANGSCRRFRLLASPRNAHGPFAACASIVIFYPVVVLLCLSTMPSAHCQHHKHQH